ncbi:MAG TPA: family 43 glycosylhydrolase [Lacipirellulaceae bacterium]|nr:family 43 glycosylhydrolase [Lacipirellulaceae bacterium]
MARSMLMGLASIAAAALLASPGAAQVNTAGQRNVHDPSRIHKVDGKYYLFYTGNSTTRILSRSSTDLVNWTSSTGLFTTAPAWATAHVPSVSNFWAPDVVFVDGEYHLYYSVSTFGSQQSGMGLATNPTLNPSDPAYLWTDRGAVLTSTNGSPYNAIDPGIFLDDDSRMYMTFGSFWNGIYVTELDPLTGKRITPNSPTIRLAQNVPSTAIEAAYLHKHEDSYYLFVNFGTCCQGTNSTYNIRVGRSASPTGPFLDKNNVNMVSGGGSLFLGSEGSLVGPGHLSIYEEDNVEIFTYHYYDATDNGRARLNWRTLDWSPDGWPVIADTLDPADFNADGDVNGEDLAAWSQDFGSHGSDAPGDGVVDGADFVIWQRRQGAGAAAAGGALPEPGAMVLAAAVAAAAVGRRRRSSMGAR